MTERSHWISPERDPRPRKVGFHESASVFFFELGWEATAAPERKEARAKRFDGRSEARRGQIDWTQIEDFLIESAYRDDVDEEWFVGTGLSGGRRRCYAQHWEYDELLSKSRNGGDEECSVSTTDDDDEEYRQMIRVMESLPCDADL